MGWGIPVLTRSLESEVQEGEGEAFMSFLSLFILNFPLYRKTSQVSAQQSEGLRRQT